MLKFGRKNFYFQGFQLIAFFFSTYAFLVTCRKKVCQSQRMPQQVVKAISILIMRDERFCNP